MKLFLVSVVISLAFSKWAAGFMEYGFNETEMALLEGYGESKVGANLLMVGLTLIGGAGAKGAGEISALMIYILHIVIFFVYKAIF